MELVLLAVQTLKNIASRNIPFAMEINHISKDNMLLNEERSTLTKMVVCALKHFLALDKVSESDYVSIIYLTNHYFLDEISNSKMDKIFKAAELDTKKAKEIIKKYEDYDSLLLSLAKKDSQEYLSYRYNVPLWTIHMWIKQYDEELTIATLKGLSKPHKTYVLDNSQEENSALIKLPYEGYAIYQGKVPLVQHSLFKDRTIVRCNPLYGQMINDLVIDAFCGVAIYEEYINPFVYAIKNRFSEYVPLTVIAGEESTYLQTKKDIDFYALRESYLCKAPYTSLIACLSHKERYFIVCPENSHLGNLQNEPDGFMRVNPDSLDKIIDKQKDMLNTVADFVEDNGKILYVVPTLNKKETVGVISDFLTNHPEFTLIKHYQAYPQDELSILCYYAVLEKRGSTHD